MKNLISHIYKKENIYRYCSIQKKSSIYNGLGISKISIKKRKKQLILRIRKSHEYPKMKVICDIFSTNIWLCKFPNTEDLIILNKKPNSDFIIYIFLNQWKYKLIFLYMIKSNPDIFYNKLN